MQNMKLASCVVVAGVLATVTIAEAEPRLRVAGAQDGVLALRVEEMWVLSRTVRVVADTGEAATNVSVELSPFEGPTGRLEQLERMQWTFERVALDAPAQLELATKEQWEPGKYIADLDVVVNQTRTTTRLEVEVLPRPLGVRFPAAVAAWGEYGGSAEVSIPLLETMARKSVRFDAFVTASRRSGDHSYRVPVWIRDRQRNGKSVLGVEIYQHDGALFTFVLGGLEAAGEYTGEVQLFIANLSPSRSGSITVPFTVTVKEPCWRALLWIGGGVLLSALMRLWYLGWRKRLEVRRSPALASERLGAPSPSAAAEAGPARRRILRGRLGELVAFGVLLAAALVTGIDSLWETDATWGGAQAHLLAVLWGFGLYQIGALGLIGGLRELRARLSPSRARGGSAE